MVHPGRGAHQRFLPVKKVRRIHNKCRFAHSLIEDQAELQFFLAMRNQRLPSDDAGERHDDRRDPAIVSLADTRRYGMNLSVRCSYPGAGNEIVRCK